jgi:hypothetical protein
VESGPDQQLLDAEEKALNRRAWQVARISDEHQRRSRPMIDDLHAEPAP